MDFGTLLHKAQKNEVTKKEPIRYYSTKFDPPKKEQRNKAQLTVNVKKFLEKKEQEEKQKMIEAHKRKEELLALRSKDKKAVKRVNVMLKRTKSANQSVIEDAVDSDNTAVTLAGPAQPDEDDYGYVSQEASAFYNKMMEKYSKMPEEPPKFSSEKKKVSTNLSSTKDRVKAALEKEKEEAMMPHKRKRKHHGVEGKDSDYKQEEKDEIVEENKSEMKKPKMEKPRPKAPPPMNFADLLKLAEKKQFEPIVVEKKTKEEENPLTKKQKRELERVKEWQERKNEKLKVPLHEIKAQAQIKTSFNKERKDNEKSSKINTPSKLSEALTKGKTKNPQSSTKPEILPEKLESEPPKKKIDWGAKHPSFGKVNKSQDKNSNNSKLPEPKLRKEIKESSDSERLKDNQKNKQERSSLKAPSLKDNERRKDYNKPDLTERKSNDIKQREISLRESMKPKQFPPRDLKTKQFPPADVRRKPSGGFNKMKVTKGRIMDDDEEEDSEMDDFIDDGPEEEEDYSKYISEIFGYNKSKYSNYIDDEDDDNMESSFAQQMKEEVISTKLGIMEDLEDMRLEEEHKRRKALMKKKMSRSK